MNFLEALELAVSVIKENARDGLDEIYLYEPSTQTQVYLKNCKGVLEFSCDEPLPEQVFLAAFLDKRLQSKCLSLSVIFSTKWEVRLLKKQHLRAIRAQLGKTAEALIDYTPVGREEATDV